MRSPEFDRAVVAARPRLVSFARSLCHDSTEAEDLTQQTILKALRGHESFEAGTNLAAWLFTILRNEFLGQRRKAVREVDDVDGVFASTLKAPADQEHAYDLKIVLGQMELLSPIQRASLELCAMDQMTIEEVAAILDIPEGTVKSQVHRARTKLLAVYEGRAEALRR